MYEGRFLQTILSKTLNVSVNQKNRSNICFKKCGQALETLSRASEKLGRAFEGLRENQMFGREFEQLEWVFEKLHRMFVLQQGLCCPNKPQLIISDDQLWWVLWTMEGIFLGMPNFTYLSPWKLELHYLLLMFHW